MTRQQLLRSLQQLVGENMENPWGADDLHGLFQRFRPDGHGLLPLLAKLKLSQGLGE